MSDTPGIETYPEYLERKGDPRDAAPPAEAVLESYPDYLARKAKEAEAADGKKAKGVEDKSVKGPEAK